MVLFHDFIGMLKVNYLSSIVCLMCVLRNVRRFDLEHFDLDILTWDVLTLGRFDLGRLDFGTFSPGCSQKMFAILSLIKYTENIPGTF